MNSLSEIMRSLEIIANGIEDEQIKYDLEIEISNLDFAIDSLYDLVR